jgi:small subunit ribosomal protein S7
MNSVMYEGKKSVAEPIVHGAFEIIEGKTKQSPVTVFEQALDNVSAVDRGALAPLAAPPIRCRWSGHVATPGARHPLDHFGARERNEKTMTERLSAELLDASNNRGAPQEREDTHKMAEANRAFLALSLVTDSNTTRT